MKYAGYSVFLCLLALHHQAAQSFVVVTPKTTSLPLSRTTATASSHRLGLPTWLIAAEDMGTSLQEMISEQAPPPPPVILQSSPQTTNPIFDNLEQFSFAILGITIFALIFTLLFSTQISSMAAKELEKQLLENYPDLYREMMVRLEPNETLASRPDLLEEYGTKLKFLREGQQQDEEVSSRKDK